MSRPLKITVATVTYHAASLLPVTLDSVKEQVYPYVEHVIVDGLSNDGTLEMVRDYVTETGKLQPLHEVKFVSEPDKGLYDAMNKALRMATGDYVLFLNAGDRLHDNTTLQQIAAMADAALSQGNASLPSDGKLPQVLPAVIYGKTDVVDGEGHFLRERRLSPPEDLSWKSFQQGMLVCHQAFFARTDLAKLLPYQLKYRFSADFDWCIRVMREAAEKKIPLCNAHLVVADYLEGGLTTKNHRRSLMERFNIMRCHYGLLSTVSFHLYFILRAIMKK